MAFNLNNKVAVVTGASRGLGAAIATYLGACGARVAVNYAHDHPSAGRVVDGILAKGGQAISVCYDITDEEAVKEMVTRVRRELGPVDIIVNNATGPQPVIPVEQQTWQDHLSIIGTQGKIVMEPVDSPNLTLFIGKGRSQERTDEQIPLPENVHLPMVQDFIDAVLQGKDPVEVGEEGIKTSRILAAIDQSVATGRMVEP